VQHGEYLVNALASCGHCHTPLKRGRPDASRTMAGGTEFKGNWGVSYAANLTPDRETGLGEWTDQQIIRAIRNGIDDNGEKLTPPMPYANYHRITDRDIRDIVAYLRSLKAVRNQVPETHPAREPSAH
jgi:mono/diheme cytochrome c family protein